ncbi:hypothetical protein D3C71_1250400 [compost metagenome]
MIWQFGDSHPAGAAEFEQFLGMLPRRIDGRLLQHALEVRNPAAWTPALLAAARAHGAALVFSGSDEYPSFADPTAGFTYARLMRSRANLRAGYPARAMEQWCLRAMRWARGEDNPDLPHLAAELPTQPPREVYVLFIGAAKQRNPGAAMALRDQLQLLGGS